MLVERYIRAYNKGTGTLMFEVKLPDKALTYLSMVDFLQDDIDPLLYACYDLTQEQANSLFNYFQFNVEADTDYFDYVLECDDISYKSRRKVKTKEELLQVFNTSLEDSLRLLVFHVTDDFERIIPKWGLIEIQDLCYKIYQEGTKDGRV